MYMYYSLQNQGRLHGGRVGSNEVFSMIQYRLKIIFVELYDKVTKCTSTKEGEKSVKIGAIYENHPNP